MDKLKCLFCGAFIRSKSYSSNCLKYSFCSEKCRDWGKPLHQMGCMMPECAGKMLDVELSASSKKGLALCRGVQSFSGSTLLHAVLYVLAQFPGVKQLILTKDWMANLKKYKEDPKHLCLIVNIHNFLQKSLNSGSTILDCRELCNTQKLLDDSLIMYFDIFSQFFSFPDLCIGPGPSQDAYVYSTNQESAASLRPTTDNSLFGKTWDLFMVEDLRGFTTSLWISYLDFDQSGASTHRMATRIFLKVHSLMEEFRDITFLRLKNLIIEELNLPPSLPSKSACPKHEYLFFNSERVFYDREKLDPTHTDFFLQKVALKEYGELLIEDTPKVLVTYIPLQNKQSRFLINVDDNYSLMDIKNEVAERYYQNIEDGDSPEIIEEIFDNLRISLDDLKDKKLEQELTWNLKVYEMKPHSKNFYKVTVVDECPLQSHRVLTDALLRPRIVQVSLKIDLYEVLFAQFELGHKQLRSLKRRKNGTDVLIIDLNELRGMCELPEQLDHFVSDSLFQKKYELFAFIASFAGKSGKYFANVKTKKDNSQPHKEWYTFLSGSICKASFKEMQKSHQYLFYKVKEN